MLRGSLGLMGQSQEALCTGPLPHHLPPCSWLHHPLLVHQGHTSAQHQVRGASGQILEQINRSLWRHSLFRYSENRATPTHMCVASFACAGSAGGPGTLNKVWGPHPVPLRLPMVECFSLLLGDTISILREAAYRGSGMAAPRTRRGAERGLFSSWSVSISWGVSLKPQLKGAGKRLARPPALRAKGQSMQPLCGHHLPSPTRHFLPFGSIYLTTTAQVPGPPGKHLPQAPLAANVCS